VVLAEARQPSEAVSVAAQEVVIDPSAARARGALIGSLVTTGDLESALVQLTAWSTQLSAEVSARRTRVGAIKARSIAARGTSRGNVDAAQVGAEVSVDEERCPELLCVQVVGRARCCDPLIRVEVASRNEGSSTSPGTTRGSRMARSRAAR
jgi:hypothetical protein